MKIRRSVPAETSQEVLVGGGAPEAGQQVVGVHGPVLVESAERGRQRGQGGGQAVEREGKRALAVVVAVHDGLWHPHAAGVGEGDAQVDAGGPRCRGFGDGGVDERRGGLLRRGVQVPKNLSKLVPDGGTVRQSRERVGGVVGRTVSDPRVVGVAAAPQGASDTRDVAVLGVVEL